MIDHQQRKLRLIDWALWLYHPGREEHPRRLRGTSSPELLVDLQDKIIIRYGLCVHVRRDDIRREPFFHGHDNYDQLVKIAKVLGTDDPQKYLDKYELELIPTLKVC